MVKKILVPVDGSETATKALKYAAALAKQTGAMITLLSVIDRRFHVVQRIPAPASAIPLTEPMEDYLRQTAKEFTDAAEKICGGRGVRSKKVVRSGHPTEEILKEAEKSKVDLIIMGSHGKSALEAAFLGSITFGVIHRDTKYPVLIVRK
jgi:nucleotide-binding universal stress UspA family protein